MTVNGVTEEFSSGGFEAVIELNPPIIVRPGENITFGLTPRRRRGSSSLRDTRLCPAKHDRARLLDSITQTLRGGPRPPPEPPSRGAGFLHAHRSRLPPLAFESLDAAHEVLDGALELCQGTGSKLERACRDRCPLALVASEPLDEGRREEPSLAVLGHFGLLAGPRARRAEPIRRVASFVGTHGGRVIFRPFLRTTVPVVVTLLGPRHGIART